jgi:hypothetical protein
MNRIRSTLALALLLVFAQQGAVLHELSHVYRTGAVELKDNANVVDVSKCALCLAFAQVANPASASAVVLPLAPAIPHPVTEPEYSIIAAAAPSPRSRGPPVLS